MRPRAARSQLDPKLPDGRTTVQLVASDRAGNRSVITRTVAVDRTAPRVHIDRVPALIGTAHPTLRGSLDDASPVTVKALLDGTSVALRAPDGRAVLGNGAIGTLLAAAAARRRRACTRSRSRRPTPPATRRRSRRAVHRRLDREAAQLQRAVPRRPRCRRRAARAPAQGLRHLQGPLHALLQRAHGRRRAGLPARARPARHGHRHARSCCSSAPSASSCTSTASASS